MPKRVPEGEKRVSLNCLVLPSTLEYLKSADGSQGATVDRAVAALKMQEAQGRVSIELRKNLEKHFQPEPLAESPNVVKSIRGKLGMKTGKRGHGQKGDKQR